MGSNWLSHFSSSPLPFYLWSWYFSLQVAFIGIVSLPHASAGTSCINWAPTAKVANRCVGSAVFWYCNFLLLKKMRSVTKESRGISWLTVPLKLNNISRQRFLIAKNLNHVEKYAFDIFFFEQHIYQFRKLISKILILMHLLPLHCMHP